MKIRAPTPVTVKAITVESGSPRNATSTVKPPAAIHWYSCLTNCRSAEGSANSLVRSPIATPNDAVPPTAASQPADRPGQRRPVSSSTTPATRGNSGISGTRFTPSPPKEARVVHVRRVTLAVERDDDRQSDDHLGPRDPHRAKRNHL